MKCGCCGKDHEDRGIEDPWEGRLYGYCYGCALTRCDAYPGECNGEDWSEWDESESYDEQALVGHRCTEDPCPHEGTDEHEGIKPLVQEADPEIERLLAEEEAIERSKGNPMSGYGPGWR